MPKRKNISKEVKDKILVDCMHRCCLCPEHQEVLDIHHIVPISEKGPNTEENLMAICPTCHAKIHRIRGRYNARQLKMYKKRWVELCWKKEIPLEEKIAQAPSIELEEEISTFIPHPYPEAPNFTGRKKEREMLTNWLTEDKEHPLLSMVAIGGMGKSALAWRWLQEEVIEKGLELDGVVWWSFYEREATFGVFINEVIGYLFPGKGEELIKRSAREKQDLVLNQLFNHRFLLVFDGFERTLRAYYGMNACYIGEQFKREEGEKYRQCVDPNLSWFIRSLGNVGCKTKTLFTTRLHPIDLKGLAGVREEKLKRMEPEDAVEFFKKQRVKGSAPEIRQACAKYDFLPLCLRLLSGLLITSRKYKGDIKYAQEIPDLRLTDVDEYHRDAKKFEHILQFSYDNLKDENKALISSIGAFRSPMEFDSLYSIFGRGTDQETFRKKLDCLERRGMLLYDFEKDHYDLHPVVRRYCYRRLTSPKETHENIRQFFAKVVGVEEEPELPFDIDEEELNEMTVAELKEICDELGISKTGEKSELVKRILESQEIEGEADTEYFEKMLGRDFIEDKDIYYNEEELSEMAVEDLKEICVDMELSKSGKKKDIVQRIIDAQELDKFEEEEEFDRLSIDEMEEMPKWQLQDICEHYYLKKSGTKEEIIERLDEFYNIEWEEEPGTEEYYFDEEELNNMTVSELKEICDELGLSKSGRKANLIERILDNQEIEEELDLDLLRSLLGPESAKVEKIEDLQPVIELYHHTVGAGRYDEACDLYRDRLDALYYQFGAYNTITEILNALFPDGYNKPKLSDESDLAWTYNEFANTYSLSGQPHRAVPVFDQAVKLAEKMENKRNVAIGLGNLAYPQIAIGDLESAESNLRRMLKIAIEIEDRLDDPYTKIARIEAYTGRFEDCKKSLTEAEKDDRGPQSFSVIWAYHSLRALLMDDPKEALKCANKALEFAKKWELEVGRKNARDFIVANWLIGTSYVAMKDIKKADAPLQFAITECRKINMVDHEAVIELELAKSAHLRGNNEESLKLVNDALEIANRCGYVLQQADIHLFLAEFYKELAESEEFIEIPKEYQDKPDFEVPKESTKDEYLRVAKWHATRAKLRSHQMIDVKTGDYITKPEDTKWKYKPCYDKAVNFLSTL